MMASMTEQTDAGDEALLAAYAEALGEGIEGALAHWVEGCVERVLVAWSGAVPASARAAAVEAGRHARADAGPQVRELLASDVDEQRTTPLALVRGAVRYPTEVLRAAGVPPVVRDASAEAAFPEDDYDLSPGAFADLDPSLAEPGLTWGAAKAHVVLRRRRGHR